MVDWLADIGQYDITIEHDGMGKKKHDTNHYLTGRDGGRDIDLRKFALEGMALYGRMETVSQGRMIFAPNLKSNLDEADRVYNGINALIDRHIARRGYPHPMRPSTSGLDTGARGHRNRSRRRGHKLGHLGDRIPAGWSFVGLPIFDGSGYPVQRRGVTGIPGVYVLGLPWLWTWGSGRFLSVGKDAEHVVDHLATSLACETFPQAGCRKLIMNIAVAEIETGQPSRVS